jgi:transposase
MLQPREFEFILIWNIPVVLSYTMRRVNCPACGIKVEAVPWAQGKHASCDVFRHFLASWARRMNWEETAACFHSNWGTVCRSVKWVVEFGLKHRDLNDITAMLPAALNVLDRFHIAKKLGEAVDEVRRQEVKQLAADGYEPILKNSRYWFLKKWCTGAMRSKLAPMKKFVGTLRNHEDLLLNYFKANKLYSSGIVEGLNLRINLCMRKAYGYRSFKLLQISLYHTLGDLPQPKFTHKFCGRAEKFNLFREFLH